jgi:protein-L-isoaspartate(D-aspartate) O-methyltransferase
LELATLRQAMVETQLRHRGIGDKRVLQVMAEIPRHDFVAPSFLFEAYEDHPLPIGEGQTISQPYMVAIMTEALELEPPNKVLEIGTGSGYQTAILARLAAQVYTIEKFPSLAAAAEERLRGMGFLNISFHTGDGSGGWPQHAPYDAILVTAGAPYVPGALVEQLAEGGRLVIPVGDTNQQELLQVIRRGSEHEIRSINYCRFVPLTGKYGWGE